MRACVCVCVHSVSFCVGSLRTSYQTEPDQSAPEVRVWSTVAQSWPRPLLCLLSSFLANGSNMAHMAQTRTQTHRYGLRHGHALRLSLQHVLECVSVCGFPTHPTPPHPHTLPHPIDLCILGFNYQRFTLDKSLATVLMSMA